jgi:cation diffusion facilitator family transporter
MRVAMCLSLAIGVLMLAGKVAAYLLTGSAAILSDAAESVIHVVAVAFAAFSLRVSARPADRKFPFGYERIAFFSAGFEGALIILAAVGIIIVSIQKWIAGIPLERLGEGSLLIVGAAALNAALGLYLVRVGKQNQSLILEANGKHVLTDSLTSFGVLVGLALVHVTGWKPFDPL